MKPSEKQKQILDFALKNDNKITKKEAIDLIGHNYFLNAQKYVGEVLTRMVKSHLLKRIKNGQFEISQEKKQTVKGITDPNQLELL
jgi:hypothetical protein